MLEQVDLNRSLSDDDYHERMAALKLKMYDLGHAVYVSKTPVVVVFEGWACAGKGRAIAELTSRLDPRGFRVYPISRPNCVEIEFPWLQRFWLHIPAYGEMSIFDGSWYRHVTLDRAAKEIDKAAWAQALQDIREFERTLADDGTVIVKFFLHISEKEQKRRIKRLLANTATAWQVGEVEMIEQDKYDRIVRLTEQVLEQTAAEHAPWTVVPATDSHLVDVQVFETLIERLDPVVKPSEAPLPADTQQKLDAILGQDSAGLGAPRPDEPSGDDEPGTSHA